MYLSTKKKKKPWEITSTHWCIVYRHTYKLRTEGSTAKSRSQFQVWSLLPLRVMQSIIRWFLTGRIRFQSKNEKYMLSLTVTIWMTNWVINLMVTIRMSKSNLIVIVIYSSAFSLMGEPRTYQPFYFYLWISLSSSWYQLSGYMTWEFHLFLSN